MPNRKLDKSLTSRYEITKSLGDYPPWKGMSVSDRLSEKSYLLFSLLPPAREPLAIDDFRMRDYLFARGGSIIKSTLSLQKSNGGINFLLPAARLIPIKKALPSMKPEQARQTLELLLTQVLTRHREGLVFHNLHVESIVIADGQLKILPTAYLLPGEILELFPGRGSGPKPHFEPLYADLHALGRFLSLFSRYVEPDISERCSSLSQQLSSLSPETDRDTFYHTVEELSDLAGFEPTGLPPVFRRRPAYITPDEGARAVAEAARKALGGEKHLLLVRGASGEGKTSFLRHIADRLVSEWGFRMGFLLGSQALFGNTNNLESIDENDFVLIDDHYVDPLLCCHVIDRVCQYLERCNLAAIAISEQPPRYFIEAIEDMGQRDGLTIAEIELETVSMAAKQRAFSRTVPAKLEKALSGLDEERPLSFFDLTFKTSLAGEGRSGSKTKLPFLEGLSREARSVLNFLCVFRFEVPLAVLENIYSTEDRNIYETLHWLVSRGLIRSRVEPSILSNGELCLVYCPTGRSIWEPVTSSISVARRRQLHRSIVLMLKEIKDTPPLYIFYHLAEGGKRPEAAMKGYELFHMLLRRKNLCAINCFHQSYLKAKLDTSLPPELRFKLLLDLGNFFSLIGRMGQAESLYRRCREKTTKERGEQEFRALAVEAVRRECEILEKKGEFQKANRLLEKTLSTHRDHILSHERAKLYNDLAWIHYRLGQFDKSWENCLLVHKLLDEKQHPLEIAQAYNLMGAINWNRSRYDDAIMCHKRCLSLREEANDEIGTAASYNNLGLVYRSMDRVTEALEAFKKSMAIKQSHNNLPGMAAAHLNIALAYLDMENFKEAEANSLTASQLAEKIGNQQLLAETYGTLGEIQQLQGNHVQAREYYFQDLHICHSTRSIREKAMVLRRLGELSLAEGKITETRELLSQAKKLDQKIGSHLETTLLSLLEGRILLAEGKREQGRRRLEGASLELSLLGRKGKAAATTAEMGELYLDEGNEPLAREYLLRAVSLAGEGKRLPAQVKRLQEKLDRKMPLSLEEIHTDAERFRALCRIISLIRTIHDPERLHRTITESARKITGMERAALILQSDEGETLRVLAAAGGFETGGIMTDRNIIAILDIARQLGYPLDISRTDIPEGRVSEGFLEEHPSIICTPLWIRDEVTGFLYLDSPKRSTATTDQDHSFLVAFSQQVALGLERILLADRVTEMEKPKPAVQPLPPKAQERITFQDIIGSSPAIRSIIELIDGIKDMDMTVLLTGPTGTGKDLIAKTIHHSSCRRGKVIHSLNCSNIPRELIGSILFGHEKGAFTGAHRQKIGFFESAKGGTIFLNEIGDMPMELQASLLRVLEEQKFYRVGGTKEIKTDVRIIAATHKDLLQLVKEGRFREDLYYRINIFPIRVPALKERREDIKLIANHFLTTYCRLYNISVKKISPEAMAYLVGYHWPGNVRELENAINRAIIVSRTETILPEDLPDTVVKRHDQMTAETRATLEEAIEALVEQLDFSAGDTSLSKIEGLLVKTVVDRVGDKKKAAAILGISKPTVYSKLKNNEKNH